MILSEYWRKTFGEVFYRVIQGSGYFSLRFWAVSFLFLFLCAQPLWEALSRSGCRENRKKHICVSVLADKSFWLGDMICPKLTFISWSTVHVFTESAVFEL